MSELSKLRDDHAKLARLFRRLGEVIEMPAAPAQVELFELRRELVSTLLAHLKLEDWALYTRLIESGDEDATTTKHKNKNKKNNLAPANNTKTDKKNTDTIAGDWTGYCSDTRAI